MAEKKIIMLGDLNPNQIFGGGKVPRNQNRVYSASGIAPTLCRQTGGGLIVKIKDDR